MFQDGRRSKLLNKTANGLIQKLAPYRATNVHSINADWLADWSNAGDLSFTSCSTVLETHAPDVFHLNDLCHIPEAIKSKWYYIPLIDSPDVPRMDGVMTVNCSMLLQKAIPPTERLNDWRMFMHGMNVSMSQGQPQEIGKPNTDTSKCTLEEVYALWISDQLWIIHCTNFKMQWVNY